MDKLTLTVFTDPMMGLSWECEPIFRKLETHFPGQIEFRNVMSLLVDDVYRFVDPADLRHGKAYALERYLPRLARIYREEESISGMPIPMAECRLFDTEHTSSLPLNLAYQAARLSDPDKAEQFLYALRFATVVECRPTTHVEEILEIARDTGLNEECFLRHFQDGSAQAELEKDLLFRQQVGIRSLPAYLIQYGEHAEVFHSFSYSDFAAVIGEVTGGAIQPVETAANEETLRQLLNTHPLISAMELREAYDLPDLESVKALAGPMVKSGEVTIREVGNMWFVQALSGRIDV